MLFAKCVAYILLKEFILERVLNLGGPLLKDSAMLESVMQSKEDICMAEEGCHEAEVL